MIDKWTADKLWIDVFGAQEWAKDCFGTWIHKDAWNIDHIRPKSDFLNEFYSDFYNNYEPMHRQIDISKSDNYPQFEVNDKKIRFLHI